LVRTLIGVIEKTGGFAFSFSKDFATSQFQPFFLQSISNFPMGGLFRAQQPKMYVRLKDTTGSVTWVVVFGSQDIPAQERLFRGKLLKPVANAAYRFEELHHLASKLGVSRDLCPC